MPQPNAQTFRRSVDSGLLLPPELSRERQVWTRDEWRLLERCTALLHGKGLALQMQCQHDACKKAILEPSRLGDGSFQLQCPHATRVMGKDSHAGVAPGFAGARVHRMKPPSRKHR